MPEKEWTDKELRLRVDQLGPTWSTLYHLLYQEKQKEAVDATGKPGVSLEQKVRIYKHVTSLEEEMAKHEAEHIQRMRELDGKDREIEGRYGTGGYGMERGQPSGDRE